MKHLLALLAATTLVCDVAYARESGDIRGEIVDADGLPVPGAELILSGADLAGERRVTTGADGGFRFDGLLPGVYDLSVVFAGSPRASAKVVVNAERETWVALDIDLSDNVEEIDVVYIQPVIDTTDSSVSHTMTQAYLQNLPTGRSYQDIVNTLPGVSGRVDTSEGGGGSGNPSVRGEGQYGNSYTLDGVSMRDPATKTFGQDVNYDAIEEIQVYTDGAPAEFGQFTGMAVNVVTKDGGDEHHGSAALFYSQHAWVGKERFRSLFDPGSGREILFENSRSWNPNIALTAGGPILKEKLWYFTALDFGVDLFQGRTACDAEDDAEACKERLATDEARERRRDLQSDTIGGNLIAKLTWFPREDLVVRYLYNQGIGFTGKENAGDPLVAPEADTNRRQSSMMHLVTLTWIPDERTELVWRAGFNQLSLDVVPVSGDELAPSFTDFNGVQRGNAANFDLNDRFRVGGGFTLRKFVPNAAGTHDIKMGAEYWWLKETRDLLHTGRTNIDYIGADGQPAGFSADVGTEYAAGPPTIDPDTGELVYPYPCSNPDGSDCGFRQHWTNAGALGTRAHTFFAFLQDDWTPTKGLTFNVGARLDIEDGRNDSNERPISQVVGEYALPPDERTACAEGEPQGPCTLGPLFMVSPRVGMNWDITRDNKTKLSAFYGWFYDLQGADFWSWANTRSADGYVRYGRDGAGDWSWLQTQDNIGNPLIYSDDARPARMTKVIVGLEREIIDLLAVGVRGIFSRTSDIPEDVNVDLDNWYVLNAPIKDRYYRAFEVWLNKRFDGHWQMFASYTLQESWGTNPGQFETASGADSGSNGNNVGVFLDDIGEESVRKLYYDLGYGSFMEGFKGLGRYSVTDPEFQDDAGYKGYLPYHSFHSIKVNGSYTAPWGTTLGVVYEFDSGHAWQKRTLVNFYGYDGMAQGRGTRFMPAVHYLDVHLAHTFTFPKEDSLELSLDLFNLPGLFTPVTYFENDTPGFGSTLYRQSPRSLRAGLKYRW
jgi:hypothetical protein